MNRHNRDRGNAWTSRRNKVANAVNEELEGAVGAGARTGGWLSSSGGRGMGLGEAFMRTGEDGVFIPRTRPSLADREGMVSESRIPRTRTFSPEAAKRSLSPPRAGREAYVLKGREGRAVSAPTIDYESEDTGAVRQTSPSPGPRDRRWTEKGSGSDALNMSLVEDPTNDDFDKKMTQFQRDQERVKRALNSTTPIIFKRADIGPRVAETTRTLARKTSESSLDEREPPIRRPATWGSKARKNTDWMAKILSPDTSLEMKDPVEDPVSSEQRPRTASDIPLPSVEDRSSIQEPTPPASRPASAQPINASPEKSKMWDADLDFTAQSLQISTSPQLRVKSAKIDELRSREIQNLTARAVATNRLEEIRERNSEERSLVSEPAQMSAKDVPPKEEPASEEYEYHEKTILEEEGEKIPFAPITVFRAKDYEDYVKRNGLVSSRSSSSSSSRPGSSGHRRDDSHGLLRRLSRSMSSSPAPPKMEEKEEPINRSDTDNGSKKLDIPNRSNTANDSKVDNPAIQNRIEKPEKPIVHQNPVIQDRIIQDPENLIIEQKPATKSRIIEDPENPIVQQNPANETDDPEERIAAEARLFELQDKSERGSVRAPSPSDETPRPAKVDPMSLPTPRVTGAFFETPIIRKSRSTSPRPETAEPQPQPRPHPPLINTAKRISAAEDLRRIQLEAQLEDSTLDDFDAILETEAAAEGHTTTVEPVLDLEYNERGLPLSKEEIERRIERLTLDRMNRSLKATSTSIRDARHGIERLEEQISSSFIKVAKPEDGGMYINIKIPVPRLYIRQPPEKPGMKPGWKFTWFGFILSLFFVWYVSESVMCAQFCHPTNSRVNTWQPSDPFFPWAIPTKLDQWTGEAVSSSLGSLASSFGIPGWEWGPTLPKGYKGGPVGSSDWWLGRSGPVGIVGDDRDRGESIFSDDEMI